MSSRFTRARTMTDERSSGITIQHRLPDAHEHHNLAVRVGWEHGFHWPSVPASLAGSLFGVVALDGDAVVGMGRLVGDGAVYFYIQDVAVDPDYQGRGIGRMIVEALLRHIRETAPGPAFVGLFATDPALPLYERYGFTRGDMTGMFQVIVPAAHNKEDE
jgi:ribosomal protein S18 acetylase RimI-like enzyme